MPNPTERISFGEFAARKNVRERLKHAFSAHVIATRGRLDHRTAAEWEKIYSQFLAADRRRHAC